MTDNASQKLRLEQDQVYSKRNEAILKVMRDPSIPAAEKAKLYLTIERTGYEEFLALYDLCDHEFVVTDESWRDYEPYIARSCRKCNLRMEVRGKASREQREKEWSKSTWKTSYSCVAHLSAWEYRILDNIQGCCKHNGGIYNESGRESGPYYCKLCNTLRPPPPGVYIDMWDPVYHP